MKIYPMPPMMCIYPPSASLVAPSIHRVGFHLSVHGKGGLRGTLVSFDVLITVSSFSLAYKETWWFSFLLITVVCIIYRVVSVCRIRKR